MTKTTKKKKNSADDLRASASDVSAADSGSHAAGTTASTLSDWRILADMVAFDPDEEFSSDDLDTSDEPADRDPVEAHPVDGRVDQILVHLAVARAIPGEVVRGLAERDPLAVAIIMPSETWAAPVQRALDRLVASARERLGLDATGTAGQHHSRFSGRRTTSWSRGDTTELAEALLRGGRLIVHTDSEAALPTDVRLVLDAIVTLEPPDGRLVAAAIQIVTGVAPEATDLDDLQGLSLETLAMAIRRGSSATDCVRRLHAARDRLASVYTVDDVPPLEAFHGYGEAGEWGLALARDFERLRAGEAVDLPRGVLLSGPPGVGKSMFARALARSCGVPLHLTSVGAWFATGEGHLGDIARAAKTVIDRARAIGGILFIDEIDSLVGRDQVHGRNASFQLQFVNTLLALIDGCLGSPGFVLVGACNDATRVDAALRRSGRLDRPIEIGLPDVDAREGILRMHLGDDLRDADLRGIARATEGVSGADLARIVRDARQAARDAGRALGMTDLETVALPVDLRTPQQLRDTAVHEAGHVVGAVRLGLRVERADLILHGSSGGGVLVERGAPVRTLAEIEAEVVFLLCGRAADEIVGRGANSGAGGFVDSDLARATHLVAVMHASLGLRGTLTFRAPSEMAEAPAAIDPWLAARVEEDLQRLYARARTLIEEDASLCVAIADALVARRSLSASDIAAVVAAVPKGPDEEMLP